MQMRWNYQCVSPWKELCIDLTVDEQRVYLHSCYTAIAQHSKQNLAQASFLSLNPNSHLSSQR